MADVDHNLAIWSREWDWAAEGDEWSAWWGGTRAMWYGALLPRIHSFLPAGTILEVAPGYGRWTQFLKDACEQLVIVDLAERCIEHCRERFSTSANIEYHVNDGRSLQMVADNSVDFAFSFDSMVHVDANVMNAYLEQLARKLTPDGIGFIHHSNIGSYRALTRLARKAPASRLDALARHGVLINLRAWRDESMTADLFAQQCEAAGLLCIGQEKINWEHGRYLIDCISQFTRRGSRCERSRTVVKNPRFTDEARRMARLYAG
jgi:SAM-dependent methyltransferase